MSRETIILFLKRNKTKQFSAGEIAKKLKLGESAIRHSLIILRKINEVLCEKKRKEGKCGHWSYLYKYKNE